MPELTSGVTGYLYTGGVTFQNVTTMRSGLILPYTSRKTSDALMGVDLVAARWASQRGIEAILRRVGLPEDLAIIELVDPAGGETPFAVAFREDESRDSRVWTTKDFVTKMDKPRSTDLLAAMQKAYAASTHAGL